MPGQWLAVLWHKGTNCIRSLLVGCESLSILSGILSALVYGNVWKTARSGLGQYCLQTKGEGYILETAGEEIYSENLGFMINWCTGKQLHSKMQPLTVGLNNTGIWMWCIPLKRLIFINATSRLIVKNACFAYIFFIFNHFVVFTILCLFEVVHQTHVRYIFWLWRFLSDVQFRW